jgi:hypothetical protein
MATPDLVKLVKDAQRQGAEMLLKMARRAAIKHVRKQGVRRNLFDSAEVADLAANLATSMAVADLLGRVKMRRRAKKNPLVVMFAVASSVQIAAPEDAVAYFLRLVPSLDVDAERFGEFYERQAFTLAQSINEEMTARVQDAISKAIRSGISTADATADIDAILDAGGISPTNPQYGEMVFRTNAMDAYNSGHYAEARAPDLAPSFPVWQYVGIRDGRQGKDHEPKFDRYYPAAAPFAEVRGNRPFNCRCTFRWVFIDEWDDLQKQGFRVETSW